MAKEITDYRVYTGKIGILKEIINNIDKKLIHCGNVPFTECDVSSNDAILKGLCDLEILEVYGKREQWRLVDSNTLQRVFVNEYRFCSNVSLFHRIKLRKVL